MENVILDGIEVNKNRVKYNFSMSSGMKDYFTANMMFIEYENDVSDIPESILAIPFVACLLPLMWLTDSVMWIKEIDRTFYNAILRIKAAYQDLYPHYPLKGRFVAAKTINNSYSPTHEALLLFSGGLDAHTTYLRISDKQPALCNIQGWFSNIDSVDNAADADYRDISHFAVSHGNKFFYIRSNFACLINATTFNKRISKKLHNNWWYGFQHSMAFISIAIPIAYREKFNNIYIASSYSLGTKAICASYATTDIEFKFAENGGCIHDGFEMVRQNKIGLCVAHQKMIDAEYPIRVCSFNDKNCCKCEKCFRTILGITAENGDPAKFGFTINGDITEHFKQVMKERLYNYGVKSEQAHFWPAIRERILDNYENIDNKKFVDWFLSYNFVKNRKKALLVYYFKNFFKIIKRKLGVS